MGFRSSYDRQPNTTQSVMAGAATGASAGAVLGPKGALIGGIIGAGLGLFQANEQRSAMRRAERQRKRAIRSAIKDEMGARDQLESMSRPIPNQQPSSSGGQANASNSMQGIIGENINNTPTSAGTF
jgi:gas vesicle protein